jgi:hypothetical protein
MARVTFLKDGLKVNNNEMARQFTSAAMKVTFMTKR